MKPRLLIVLLLLVLAPLAALAWLGVRLARHEQVAAERQIEAALRGRLDDLAAQIDTMMEDRRRALLAALAEAEASALGLRELTRGNPFVAQGFVLAPDGRLLYPNPADPNLNEAEWAFLRRAQDVLSPGELLAATATEASSMQLAGQMGRTPQQPVVNPFAQQQSAFVPLPQSAQSVETLPQRDYMTTSALPQMQRAQPAPQQQMAQGRQMTREQVPVTTSSGWYAWYWGRGAHVLLWRRDELGRFAGVELNGARLLADVIALLPDSTPQSEKRVNLFRGMSEEGTANAGTSSRYYEQAELLRLVDTGGTPLYQWAPRGPMELAAADARPVVSRPLAPPLHAWALELHLPDGALGGGLGRGAQLALAMGLAALALALGGMALYLGREHTRAMREAAQRVTFVNQVSHELKTPLTNIRMYAEMLDDALSDEAEGGQPRGHLDVILAESQRLSRLIGNILTFARRQRNGLTLHPQPGVIDETVAGVVGHFRPALAAQNIEIVLNLDAPERVRFDADVLEQILGNLLNNVEKYAPGAVVTITTRRDAAAGRTMITVADTGPGIAPAHREKIFAPFYRVSNRLTDGVAGTGIGLSIARDLARLHGGDLKLIKGYGGSEFEISISVEGENT